MPKVLKAQIRSFLHDYKRRVFEIEHDPKLVEQGALTFVVGP